MTKQYKYSGFFTYFESPQYSADEQHTYGEKLLFI